MLRKHWWRLCVWGKLRKLHIINTTEPTQCNHCRQWLCVIVSRLHHTHDDVSESLMRESMSSFAVFTFCVSETLVRFAESVDKTAAQGVWCDMTGHSNTQRARSPASTLGGTSGDKQMTSCTKQGNCFFAYWFCSTRMMSLLSIPTSVCCVCVHPWFACGPIVCQPP